MNFRDLPAYALIRPYVPNSLRHVLHAAQRFARTRLLRNRTLDFVRFQLLVSNRDTGGIAHETMYWHELSNPLELELIQALRPRVFVDIGANYGFSSLLHHALNPDAKLVLVEANPFLIPYLHFNLRAANADSYELINAVCSDVIAPASFAINPSYSQDSRVVGPPSWQRVRVPSVTIDSLLTSTPTDTPAFLKVDTQGYEQQVFNGGRSFLKESSTWVMKLEFGPYWLRSHGTNPRGFLEALVCSHHVCELPSRARFKGDALEAILSTPIAFGECEAFTRYVSNLSVNDRGYCDLLVLPRRSNLLRFRA